MAASEEQDFATPNLEKVIIHYVLTAHSQNQKQSVPKFGKSVNSC